MTVAAFVPSVVPVTSATVGSDDQKVSLSVVVVSVILRSTVALPVVAKSTDVTFFDYCSKCTSVAVAA